MGQKHSNPTRPISTGQIKNPFSIIKPLDLSPINNMFNDSLPIASQGISEAWSTLKTGFKETGQTLRHATDVAGNTIGRLSDSLTMPILIAGAAVLVIVLMTSMKK